MDKLAKTDKTESVMGLGRRTREEIAKWKQMTALRSLRGGRHQTSPASLGREKERLNQCHINVLKKKEHTKHIINLYSFGMSRRG